jgi:hypothetical protein
MPPEGMVHALLAARAWLAPAGRLVDLRPTPETAALEVHLASGTVAAGRVVDLPGQAGPGRRHAQAEAAAAEAVARGWFAVEERHELTFRRYAESAEEMRDYIRSKWHGGALEAGALDRAEALLRAEPEAPLCVREQVGIARLRPLARSSARLKE